MLPVQRLACARGEGGGGGRGGGGGAVREAAARCPHPLCLSLPAAAVSRVWAAAAASRLGGMSAGVSCGALPSVGSTTPLPLLPSCDPVFSSCHSPCCCFPYLPPISYLILPPHHSCSMVVCGTCSNLTRGVPGDRAGAPVLHCRQGRLAGKHAAFLEAGRKAGKCTPSVPRLPARYAAASASTAA